MICLSREEPGTGPDKFYKDKTMNGGGRGLLMTLMLAHLYKVLLNGKVLERPYSKCLVTRAYKNTILHVLYRCVLRYIKVACVYISMSVWIYFICVCVYVYIETVTVVCFSIGN